MIPYPLAPAYIHTSLLLPRKAILYCGRIHPEKGLDLLIAAFQMLSPSVRSGWCLQLVGPVATEQGGGGGHYLEKLKHRVTSDVAAIEFLGPTYREAELIKLYRHSPIFVYPSLAERGETFGLAPLEAMGSGCAPVVSDLACFRDFIKNGHNGVVFDHRSAAPAETLATELERLLQVPEYLAQLRTAALATAAKFDSASVADIFIRRFNADVEPA